MSKLYIIPTPIGNLRDITLRAIDVLKEVDEILSEDTRTSSRLFREYGIDKPLKPFHLNNEHKVVSRLVERLKAGVSMALVSDAGTPAISDPGYLIIRECLKEDVPIEVLPGPVAFIPALLYSGFPCEKFRYEGFLPHKKGRMTRINEIVDSATTTVLYESPHRLVKFLRALEEAAGPERKVSVSREITKIYEETIRGSVSEVAAHFEEHGVKGEFVVCVEGKS